MRRFSVIFFISICLFNTAVSANETAYSKEWLNLLHYHEKGDNVYYGLVENEEFYVSPAGWNNPAAEFEAEIKAFNEGTKKCLFPARFNFLEEKGLVQGNLQDCSEYQQFMKDVQPAGITVIFTNAYMNNPASLFGHTLVRIDTGRKGTQMLAHGSNFGADSGQEYGFLFAFKGLVGGYAGVYRVSPYWDIINAYNNIENRDIWEYKLNLSDKEVSHFVNHLYEMRNAKIRYYFLSKNCSYMILELLQAVRPTLKLTQQYPLWAIPLDTLKTIKAEPDLVGDIKYRPARYTRILNFMNRMSSRQYEAFIQALKNEHFELLQLTDEEKPLVLETLYQYYQYQYVDENMDVSTYRRNSFAVLRQRSRLPVIKDEQIAGEDPVASHDSLQWAAGIGVNNGRSFEQFEIRPAYTALTDDSHGLVKGAETAVFASKWRYYNQAHKFVLQEFVPLKIKSLVPVNRAFSHISYATNVALLRDYNPQTEDEGYVAQLSLGAGQTYALWGNVWIYGLMKVGGAYGGFIPENQWSGLMPEIGIYKDFGAVRLHLQSEKTWATRHYGNRLRYQADISYSLTRQVALEFSYRSSHNISHNQEEWGIYLRLFR